MGSRKESIDNIERLEAMEEQFGIYLEGLFAVFEEHDADSRYLTVTGEVHASNGATIEETFELVVSAYDSAGRVIATNSMYFVAEDFLALSPINVCNEIIEKPSKIRIYPKKG